MPGILNGGPKVYAAGFAALGVAYQRRGLLVGRASPQKKGTLQHRPPGGGTAEEAEDAMRYVRPARSSSTPITNENLIQQPAPPPVAVPFPLSFQ